ncbi:MAG: A/G-specific adenine glycosylase [Chloroflexi bacterium]|nr:A/G-specific adenine glycosylase [Chloroflexota bacterium]
MAVAPVPEALVRDARARTRIRRRVLDWYARTARPLAFRETSDPWAILVSEVMAQQTQAARAAEAWTRFMAAYPTPASLAAASSADVLRAWRGLGYNRRAIALQRAARVIVDEHGGRVPSDLEALQRLPGIGPYSARAVAALAFGRHVGAVDTNVRRVLGRAFFDEPPDAGTLQALADALVPRRQPGLWTHAVMDIGATVCRIRAPHCDACPLRSWCAYAAAPAGSVRVGRLGRATGNVPAFAALSRWLRGRILDRLRDLGDGAWLAFDDVIGLHDTTAVAVALRGLAGEGLVELREGNRSPEARLPTG